MADRKKLSGAEYRKNRLKKEKELIKLKGTFTKYLVPPTSNVMEKNENAEIPIYETSQNEVIVTTISESSILKHPSINLIANNSVTNPSSESSLTILTKTHSSTSTNSNKKLEPDFQFDFNDPGTWPKYLSDTDRCYITKMRIDSNYTPDFSKSERDGRTLTKDWFYKVLKNGSKVKRSFLAYSETKNSLYCISCRMFSHMFSHESKMSSLAKEEGLANWKKLSDKIPEHENSSNHKHYFCTWKSLETSLGMGGIDKELQDAIQKEETHWKEVLHCIVDAILYLAKQGSPFRGTNERCDFENPSSGKFLNTIALLSHYNVPLQKHIERHKKGQISYFSSDIQDEFLDIIADKIRQDIIQNVKKAKYFALMFDCTPDISNNEQMTEIIRYVNGTEVVESFLDFFLVSDKTGEGLSQEIIKKVKNDGLDLELCRAQSYDNGSNMAGKYKGVQARILKENKYAYFLPCSAHSLNLVGVHAADACLSASNYFGVLHSLYNYFSRSTSRWEVLQKHVPLTLKAESKTRWSARLESVEVIFKHIHKIFLALDELCTNGSTPETKTEAKILMGQMKDFQFSVLTSFWYSVLKPIDRANKFLQGKDVTVDRAMRNIQGLINLLSSKRENLVSEAMADAKIMAQNNGLETDFKEKRKRKKKMMPGEICEDEVFGITQEELFRGSLMEIIDRILSEMNSRFDALKDVNSKFGFLSGSQINEIDSTTLQVRAKTLADSYPDDLNKEELVSEIESFKFHAFEIDKSLRNATAQSTFKVIYEQHLEEIYPNITIALQIFLTLPVSVASAERSFSKLKLIKNYLRNTMKQQRLNNLSIISIEHQRASSISFEEIIKTFAAKKSRKIKFL